MIDKEIQSPEQAVIDIVDGSCVMIGGFGSAGMPDQLIDLLFDRGATDLTIISNNAGNGETGLAALMKHRRVYTDMAIFEIIHKECRVVELADGLTLSELEQKVDVKLRYSLS